MFKYYNAHPRGLHTDDCTKRAITLAFGLPYRQVQLGLNRHKKITGADKYYSKHNPHSYVEKVLGAVKVTFDEKMTAAEFAKLHPSGRYILDMRGHWSCCVDGVLYDTWDVSDETVNFAYLAEPVGRPRLANCCTAEQISDTVTVIRIYDGNGSSAERRIHPRLTEGYVRCLEDSNYVFVKL